jgi:3-keto-5-aminohexanoate cleavage enzyme
MRTEAAALPAAPPVLVNVCLTGMVADRSRNPYLPVSPEEIIGDAVRVCDLGAQVVHLHARDERGAPTWSAAIYERIVQGIRRERPALVCCVSTSGRLWSDFERRSEVLHLTGDAKPDMASLTLGSVMFPSGLSATEPDMLRRLAGTMREKAIKPELEIFDISMIVASKVMQQEGLVERDSPYFNLILGNMGSTAAAADDLENMIHALPATSVWAAAGIGRAQLPMNMEGIRHGGAVRVGLEDALYMDSGKSILATNAMLVERIVDLARQEGRRLATPEEVHRLLGLPARSCSGR